MVCPVLRSYQSRLRYSVLRRTPCPSFVCESHEAKLDDEVAGEVLRLGLATLLAPEADDVLTRGRIDDD
jgi:hypothetical protein